MQNPLKIILNGIFKENPTFALVLGMCPTIAVTTSAENGLSMGLAAMCVLIGSNIAISALRRIIPDEIRIPAFIVVIAGFVTVLQLVIAAWFPALDAKLGIFIPLIVVNCIILARAEAFASKNGILASAADGLGMGLGFTFALILLGGFREIIGAGSFAGIPLIPDEFHISLFVLPPGAFLVMAFLVAAMQYYQDPDRGKKKAAYPSLEDVKTVVVKPAPKPAAPKPAVEAKAPAPKPAAAEAAKAAETVKEEAAKAAETVKKEVE